MRLYFCLEYLSFRDKVCIDEIIQCHICTKITWKEAIDETHIDEIRIYVHGFHFTIPFAFAKREKFHNKNNKNNG